MPIKCIVGGELYLGLPCFVKYFERKETELLCFGFSLHGLEQKTGHECNGLISYIFSTRKFSSLNIHIIYDFVF